MNNNHFDSTVSHYLALFDLQEQMNDHLSALGFPEVNIFGEVMEDAGITPKCNGNCDHCGGCRDCKCSGDCHCQHDTEPAQESAEESEPEYVLIHKDDFSQLANDLVEMSDTIDSLCSLFQEKEHLAKTLLGIAAKLDTSSAEHLTVRNAVRTVNAISDRWDEIDLFPVDLN